MLYCRSCGQCSHISEDNFVQFLSVSGWEAQYIDCEDGDYVDYRDGETTDSEVDYTECPHCSGQDIEWDSEVTHEEARLKRTQYNREQDLFSEEMQQSINDSFKKKETQWDS